MEARRRHGQTGAEAVDAADPRLGHMIGHRALFAFKAVVRDDDAQVRAGVKILLADDLVREMLFKADLPLAAQIRRGFRCLLGRFGLFRRGLGRRRGLARLLRTVLGYDDGLLPRQRVPGDARDEPAADQKGRRQNIQYDRRPEREAFPALHSPDKPFRLRLPPASFGGSQQYSSVFLFRSFSARRARAA